MSLPIAPFPETSHLYFFFYFRLGYKELTIDENSGKVVGEFDLKETVEEVLQQVNKIKKAYPEHENIFFRLGAVIK